MYKKWYFSLFLFLWVCAFSLMANNEPLIYKINIDSEINTTSRIFLSNGLKEAGQLNATAVLLRLNTYGGALTDADSMRTALLYNDIPVYVFIDNNAASAGALISIACNKIFMRPGASIGAATVVEGVNGEQAPDKYQSYMRSIIRATAEAHGRDTIIEGKDTTYRWIRNPLIAEAMVDDRIYIPNVVDSGKVLTLTAQEALRWGFCDGIVDSEKELITEYLGYKTYELKEYQPSFYDRLKGFLTNPGFQAFLIMIIIAGIYFELQTPGFGFPSIAALTAAVLYFTPLYMDGLVQYWEILVFCIGIILVLLELFVIPGFGIAGIGGIILIGMGLIFALVNNDYFTFREVELPDLSRSVLTVLSGMLLSFFGILWLSSRIGEKGMFRKVALTTDLENSKSIDTHTHPLVGQQGKAMTGLRPSGKVMIQNEIYDAISIHSFIESGADVRVVKSENMQIYVEELSR